MKRLLIILLSIVLFLLLSLASILLFVFSQTGNEMLKPYLQQKFEAKIGIPVEVSRFKLESGRSSLDMIINKQAVARVETYYDLWNGSFEGSYHIKADRLNYQDIKLKDTDLKGNFKGVSEDIYIDGKGSALGATVEYTLNLIDNVPQKIVANIKGAQLAEVLQLIGHPALAQGKIDVEINMPDIGEETASGYGHIVLNNAYFDRVLVKELYGYSLPENSHLQGTMDASLEDKKIKLVSEVQSNLFALQIKEALADLASDQLRAAYRLDVKDMRILTKDKLAGPLKVEGDIEKRDKTIHVTGTSRSLGGELHFSADSRMDLRNLSAEEGRFSLKGSKLALQTEERKKPAGERLKIHADIDSSGIFKEGKGYINTALKSSLGDMVLDNMVYDMQNKSLKSAYTVDIPSLKELQPFIDNELYGSLLLKGQLSKEQVLNVTGSTQSLGGNISYNLVGDDLSSTLRSVPLETILGTLGHKKNFVGSASGEARYNLKEKSGAVDLDIASFQIKPSNLTSVISMAIGKDPARVIYSSTTFHADIKGEITDYTLHAIGSSSSIDITEGRLNRLNNMWLLTSAMSTAEPVLAAG
ncbi:MAG TPA: hypothetical protein VLL31_00005, partial [Sulfurovum sp.]|nr:hypothetical protein [Sulfurovum sp.]